MFDELPSIWMATIALISFKNFLFNNSSSKQKLSIFTSINFGTSPHWTNGHNDVDQQIAGIRNLSPFFNLFFFFVLIRAKDANKFA